MLIGVETINGEELDAKEHAVDQLRVELCIIYLSEARVQARTFPAASLVLGVQPHSLSVGELPEAMQQKPAEQKQLTL